MSMRDYNLHAVVCHLTKMQRVVPPPVLQRNSRFPSRHDVWCTWFFSPGGFSHCSCFRMQEETPAGHLNKSLLFTGSCVNLPHLWWLVFVPESSSTVDLQLPTEVFNPPLYLLFWAWTRMSAWSSPVKVKKKKKIVFQFWVDSSDYNQLLALKKVTTRWRRHWSLSVIVKGALPEDYTSE